MNQRAKIILINVIVAALTALVISRVVSEARRVRDGGDAGARVWFYDRGAKRLYAAPRALIPPDGPTDARVRAIVIGFQGMKNDPTQLRIAYLEKYSPDFKALLERARAAHEARLPFTEKIPPPNSPYSQGNTFIQRPGEISWHPLGAEEAQRIMGEWRAWRGPDGQTPVISAPRLQ